MADVLKEGDFVEFDYTGKIVEEKVVFDTTIESAARQHNIFDANSKYGPVKVCIGKRHVIAGLDSSLSGKEIGSKYAVRVSSKDAFGEKNPKMIHLIATNKFRQQGIMPIPGLQVNMDGILGMVKAVSGGRTIVDFNHPLAGKELEYEVTPLRVIADVKEKVAAILEVLNVKLDYEITGESLALSSDSELPKQLQENITKAMTESIPEIKAVSFAKKAKTVQPAPEKPEVQQQ